MQGEPRNNDANCIVGGLWSMIFAPITCGTPRN
jgi:hypothetical protein